MEIPKISRAEAASRLGVSYPTIRTLARKGILREFHVSGRRFKVAKADVDKYLKAANTPVK